MRTLNVVRRAELIPELLAEGGDIVLLDDDDLGKNVRAALDGAALELALNAVGGESALRLAGALSPGGTLVTYGAMGRQPVRISNGLLIFQDLALRGFWVTRWYERSSAAQREALFAQLFDFAASGALRMPVARRYPLAEAAAAIAHAQAARRSGKILFAPPLDTTP